MSALRWRSAAFVVCLLVAETYAVTGAAVTGVRLEGNTAKITILNQSQQKIIYCLLRLKEQLADGTEWTKHVYGQDVELIPGSTTEVQIAENDNVASVESADVIAAFYDNQTVQVNEGEDQAFENWKQTRKAHAAHMMEHATTAEQKQAAQRVAASAEVRRVP